MSSGPAARAAGLALMLGLAACVAPDTVRPPAVEPDPRVAGNGALELLDYGASLRELDPGELEWLHGQLVAVNEESPSSAATIRLAMLLSYRDSNHYDLDRSINLLNQVARTRRDQDPSYRVLAEFLAMLLIERRSIAVDRDSLVDDVSADRDRIEELESALAEARGALEAERSRSERLQEQLDALIALEEQLTRGEEDNGPDDAR